MSSDNHDTVLWRMTGSSGRILECVIRFAPGGVEVEIRSDGAEWVVHLFATGTEAMAWAEDAREDLMTRGE